MARMLRRLSTLAVLLATCVNGQDASIEVCSVSNNENCYGRNQIVTARQNIVAEDGRLHGIVPSPCNGRVASGSMRNLVNRHFVDWNGDGSLDLIQLWHSAESGEESLSFFEQDTGGGYFEERTGADNPFQNISANDIQTFTFADWDADGDLDLLAINGLGNLWWFINSGRGVLLGEGQQVTNLTFEPTSSIYRLKRLQAVDWDSDGDLDLILTGWGRDMFKSWIGYWFDGDMYVTYYEQQKEGEWLEFLPEDKHNPFSLVVSTHFASILATDWDADGLQDLIVVQVSQDPTVSNQPTFYRRNRDGRLFLQKDSVPLLINTGWGFFPPSLHHVDWNRDGTSDLLVAACYGQPHELRRTYSETLMRLPDVDNPFNNVPANKDLVPQVVDLDADGFNDLILTNAGEDLFFRGAPGNVFQAVDWGLSPLHWLHVAYEDYFASTGLHSWCVESRYIPCSFYFYAVDWNEDGWTDLLVRTAEDRELWLHEATGPGVINSTHRAVGYLDTTSAAPFQALDWDGDGDIDILTYDRANRGMELWEQQQDGSFTGSVVLSTEGYSVNPSRSGGFHAADWNGDGRMDMVLAYGWYCEQNPQGIFDCGGGMNTSDAIDIRSHFYRLADIDNDGTLELVSAPSSAGQGPLKVWSKGWCKSSKSCNDLGVCSGPEGRCLCLRGRDLSDCSACEEGFFSADHSATPSTCQACPRGPDGFICSRRGVCHDDTRAKAELPSAEALSSRALTLGNGTCLCSPAFSGQACELGECPAGEELVFPTRDSEAMSCQVCQPGKGKDAPGLGLCGPCQPGRYAGPSEGGVCTACEPGTFTGVLGMSSCEPCPPNTYSLADASFCLACPAGRIASESRRGCTFCPTGEYADALQGVCKACDAGFSPSAGNDTCTGCPAGRFSSATDPACVACPPGRYSGSTAASSISNCRSCPAGTWNPDSGSDTLASCRPCPPGATTLTDGEVSPRCVHPTAGQDFTCVAGQSCEIQGLQGNLAGPHHLAVFHTCASQMPVPGVPSGGISLEAEQNGTLYRWTGTFQSYGGTYELCWCAGMHGLSCSTPSAFQVRVGHLVVLGPFARIDGNLVAVRAAGETRLGPLDGEGLHPSDRLFLSRRCEASPAEMAAGVGAGPVPGVEEPHVETQTEGDGAVNVSLTAIFKSFLPAPGDYWLCWSRVAEDGLGSEFAAPAGPVHVEGPSDGQSASCFVGQHCVVEGIAGVDLRTGDQLMPSMDCSTSLPGVPGIAGGQGVSVTLDMGSTFAFGEGGQPLQVRTGVYTMCWRRPPARVWLRIGVFFASGPLGDLVATCVLGSPCELSKEVGQAVRGVGLQEGDRLLLLGGPCNGGARLGSRGFPDWELPKVAVLGAEGDFRYDLGQLPLQATPGVYQACWCPSGFPGGCTSLLDFNASAGQVAVACPAGRYPVGPAGGEVCAECPRGSFCLGGLPGVATSLACPEGATTTSTGALDRTACLCRPGYEFNEAEQQCRKCPQGRFKQELSSEWSCQPCPEGLTTFGLGSSSDGSCAVPIDGSNRGEPQNSSTVWATTVRITLANISDTLLEDDGRIQLETTLRSAAARSSHTALVQVQVQWHETGGRILSASVAQEVSLTVTARRRSQAEEFSADLSRPTFVIEVATLLGIDAADIHMSTPVIGVATVFCEQKKSVPPGVAIVHASECLCGKGFGFDERTSDCTPCAVAAFKPGVGNDACLQCPRGRTTLTEASTSSMDCICEAGTHEGTPGTCTSCPSGYFCNSIGGPHPCPPNSTTAAGAQALDVTDCLCKPGHFLAGVGTCRPCDPGTYKPGLANSACSLHCPSRASTQPGSVSISACFCLPGTYASLGAEGELSDCLSCPTPGLVCPGGFQEQGQLENATLAPLLRSHAMPVASEGYYQTGPTLAAQCKLTDEKGRSQCLGGSRASPWNQRNHSSSSVCREGSSGLMCSGCPVGYSRDRYPLHCTVCEDAPGLRLAANVLVDLLLQASVTLALASMAACSSDGSTPLHSALIRIFSQWLAACSVITTFDLEDVVGFSWAQQVRKMEEQLACARNEAAEAGPPGDCTATEGSGGNRAVFRWPPALSAVLDHAFAFAGFFPSLNSLQEPLECVAEHWQGLWQEQGAQRAKMLLPATFWLIYPFMVMLAVLFVCVVFVYILVPLFARMGLPLVKELDAEASLRRRSAMSRPTFSNLMFQVSHKLSAWGVEVGELETAVFQGGADLEDLDCALDEGQGQRQGAEPGLGNEQTATSRPGAGPEEGAIVAMFVRSRTLAVKMFMHEYGEVLLPLLQARGLSQEDMVIHLSIATKEEFSRCVRMARGGPVSLIAGIEESRREFQRATRSKFASQVTKEYQGESRSPTVSTGDRPSMLPVMSKKSSQALTLVVGLFDQRPGLGTLLWQSVPVLWLASHNMWPFLLKQFLQMVWCSPVLLEDSEGNLTVEQRLLPYPDVVCFSDGHRDIAICAFVGLGLWGVGAPVALFLRIRALGADRYQPENARSFGYLFEGYESSWWHWDLTLKRLDVGLMMVITYTGFAADEKAKLLLYPFVSGCALAVTSWAKPFDARQSNLLDFVESLALTVRFIFFSLIATLLIFDASWAATAVMGGMSVLSVALFTVLVFLHVIVQYFKAETLERNGRITERMHSRTSSSVGKRQSRLTALAAKVKAAKLFLANLLQRGQDRIELQWNNVDSTMVLEGESPDLGRLARRTWTRRLVSARSQLFRDTNQHQRLDIATAVSQFLVLWLTHFGDRSLIVDGRVICILTLSSKALKKATKSDCIISLWTSLAEHVALQAAVEQDRTFRFTADDVHSMTLRFQRLSREEARSLVNAVQQVVSRATASSGRPTDRQTDFRHKYASI